MKKKIILSISILSIVLIVLVVASLAALAQKSGKFDDADFSAPDYNNGETETFYLGEARAFNYSCHCADQPGNSTCGGHIRLQADTGSGFIDEKSDTCNMGELETCSANHSKIFNIAGTYKFRVFCDESTGTDFVQPFGEYVILIVKDSCTPSETRACPLQDGVCEGFYETCTAEGIWSGCDYGSIPNYGAEDTFGCDGLDNNCDGFVDNIDNDGDFSSPCGGIGITNELVLTGLNDDYGRIDVFGYNPAMVDYKSIWSTDTLDIIGGVGGGEIGDITHDGINDFVITRKTSSGPVILEIWTYNSVSREWYRVWYTTFGSYFVWIAGIADVDADGFTEIVIADESDNTIEVWGNDTANAVDFSQEAVIKNCDNNALYHDAVGDVNGNGIPEIIFQCDRYSNIEVWEYNTNLEQYEMIASVTLPPSRGSGSIMLIDDMECNGDVNRDGINDCVLCGNSGTSHVLTYENGNYIIDYSAPITPSDNSFTQTCSIGDITNDGYDDWFDCSKDGVRVFSYQDSMYQKVWNSSSFNGNCPIGSSFVADSDNDNRGEFLHGTSSADDKTILWESNSAGALNFENTFTWSPVTYGENIIIGNFNPDNDDMGVDCDDNDASSYPGAPEICGDGIDQDCDGSDTVCNCADNDSDNYYGYDIVFCPTGDDCNDNDDSINPGVEEVCDDGIDNNCNDQIDEGCAVCGDGYCVGNALGEDCFTCSDDCACIGKDCSRACCGDGVCSSPQENNTKCSVDCP